jgi:hypothetical protein
MANKNVASGPWAGFEVISEYGDQQAVEDGVLVDVGHLTGHRGDRATRTVWEALTREPFPGLRDVTAFTSVWSAASETEPARKGDIAKLVRGGQTYWLLENENGGKTLMYPEDY